MYINDLDSNSECAKRGKFAENEFVKCALRRHYKIRPATSAEQFSHIDFILKGINPTTRREVEVTVDVKGIKKQHRKQKKTSDKWVWLEMVNVQGKTGWVHGKANFIAFERQCDFVVVKRASIQKWVEASGRIRYDLPYVRNSWEAKYRIYTRRGRKDQITLVKMADILKLDGAYLWKKE